MLHTGEILPVSTSYFANAICIGNLFMPGFCYQLVYFFVCLNRHFSAGSLGNRGLYFFPVLGEFHFAAIYKNSGEVINRSLQRPGYENKAPRASFRGTLYSLKTPPGKEDIAAAKGT